MLTPVLFEHLENEQMNTRRTQSGNQQALLDLVVRLDFVVAVGLTVIAPLILLIRVVQRKQQAIVKVLLSYWRVSSLLMVAVYLLIGERPIAFMCGVAARLLIPWTVLRHARTADPWYERWRTVVSGYCLVGAALNGTTLRCLGNGQLPSICRAYIKPAQQYGDVLHPNVPRQTLGKVGEIGLFCYVVAGIAVTGKRLLSRERPAS
jgi:hypothetical protein